jgi:hypothetical protein
MHYTIKISHIVPQSAPFAIIAQKPTDIPSLNQAIINTVSTARNTFEATFFATFAPFAANHSKQSKSKVEVEQWREGF